MCIIIDTNRCADFANATPDMQPVREWVEKRRGSVVYSDYPQIYDEYRKIPTFLELLKRMRRDYKAKMIPQDKVKDAWKELDKSTLKSNDAHIIALGIAGRSKLLATKDQKLAEDFKNEIPKGKVYKTKRNKDLLRPDTCP